ASSCSKAGGKDGSRAEDEGNTPHSTLNAQRPMQESDSDIDRWTLDVGRWAFAPFLRNGFALAQNHWPHRRSDCRWIFHLPGRGQNDGSNWFCSRYRQLSYAALGAISAAGLLPSVARSFLWSSCCLRPLLSRRVIDSERADFHLHHREHRRQSARSRYHL